MAANKRNTSKTGGQTVTTHRRLESLAIVIDHEAARLAGVSRVLELEQMAEHGAAANALGVLRDVVGAVNERISNVAAELRRIDGHSSMVSSEADHA